MAMFSSLKQKVSEIVSPFRLRHLILFYLVIFCIFTVRREKELLKPLYHSKSFMYTHFEVPIDH